MSHFPPPPPLSQGQSPGIMMEKPSNYLVWAILATLCCCLPTGIVAIVYAAQVDGKWEGGNWAGARDSSDKAKLWCWISLGVGLIGGGIYILLGGMASTQTY